jgi:DNA polymerase-4
MGTQRALGRRARAPHELDAILVGLVDRLSGRLRAAHRVCRTVTLRLRFDDFMRATRSHTLPEPTDQTQAVLATARALLATAMPLIQARGLMLLGITFGNLSQQDPAQLELAFDRQSALDAALDHVRDRFGSAAITRAVLLGRDQGVTMPLLPD